VVGAGSSASAATTSRLPGPPPLTWRRRSPRSWPWDRVRGQCQLRSKACCSSAWSTFQSWLDGGSGWARVPCCGGGRRR